MFLASSIEKTTSESDSSVIKEKVRVKRFHYELMNAVLQRKV